MHSTPPPSDFDSRLQPREREAQTVAGLFRSSRLTLLLGEEGAGKTTLVKSSVLPIMDRRARNLASALLATQRVEAAGATPPSDRRKAAADAPNAGRYATVFFDQWDAAPLAGLRIAIDDASRQIANNPVEPSLTLADALIGFAHERGVHFLIVFDRFEAFLATPESDATREFADQLVATLNAPFLPANFLISMRDDAEPLLESLAQRVPGFGDARLRVLPVRRAPHRSESGEPATSRVDRGEGLISRAFGSSTVDFDITTGPAESAESVEIAPAPEAVPAPDSAIVADAAVADANAASATTTAEKPGEVLAPPLLVAEDAAPRTRVAPARRRWTWLATATAAGALLFAVVANRPDSSAPKPDVPDPKTAASAPEDRAPQASNEAAQEAASSRDAALAPSPAPAEAQAPSAPTAATVPAPPPAAEPQAALQATPAPAAMEAKSDFRLAVDAESSTTTRFANDLAKAVARDGIVIDVRATNEPSAGLLGESGGEPRLIIARRDALETARQSYDGSLATKAPRILMPLFTEELYFIVRVDSPLRTVHQIENKRINIGAPNGARASTAKSVYQAMFGRAMPAAAGGGFDVNRALDALTRDRSIDAIVLVASQPAAFLTDMPRPMRERIKLLRLDAGDPAERRALRSYLPATLRRDANRVLPYQNIQTLAVMSFLLASPPADPASTGRLDAFAKSVCRNLPALRREGDPHWRAVRPGQTLNFEWPDAGAAAASLRACGKTSAAEPRRKRAKRRR